MGADYSFELISISITHCTKMGADSLAENTPNAPELSAQFVCPSPKVLDFNKKRLHWATVVRGFIYE